MRTIQITGRLLLLTAFTAGCSDQPTTPMALSDGAVAPAFNFSNGPATPGPIIVRDQASFAVFYADLNRGVSAIHGVDIVDFCTTFDFSLFELVDRQRVSEPNEAAAVNELLQGDDLTTSVWPFTAFSCGSFLTTTPLATGTVDLRNTDNDFFAFLRSEPARANAFGFTAQGRLNRTSGGTAHFNGIFRAVFKPGESFKAVEKINLQ